MSFLNFLFFEGPDGILMTSWFITILLGAMLAILLINFLGWAFIPLTLVSYVSFSYYMYKAGVGQ